MYPYELFFGLDLYAICITVGVMVGIYLVRLQADLRGMRAKWTNFMLMLVPVVVIIGYLCAVLMQGLYNIAAEGAFTLNGDTGSTFYGGLIGGVASGVLLYFTAGRVFCDKAYLKAHLRDALNIAPAVIAMAHGFGRIGCLMAGCCHGRATDAWYGVETLSPGYRVVPVQLYEALFLIALSIALVLMMKKGLRYQLPTYMLAYGVWRFIIEYARDDDRGTTFVRFLSPSQLVSVCLIAGGVALLCLWLSMDQRAKRTAEKGAEHA